MKNGNSIDYRRQEILNRNMKKEYRIDSEPIDKIGFAYKHCMVSDPIVGLYIHDTMEQYKKIKQKTIYLNQYLKQLN